jgi:hypothetical protein
MSSSSHSRSPLGQAEASSSRTSNGKQPAVEDDHSDEEALLADDPLARDLPEQYARLDSPHVVFADVFMQNILQAQAQSLDILLRLLAIPPLTPQLLQRPRVAPPSIAE